MGCHFICVTWMPVIGGEKVRLRDLERGGGRERETDKLKRLEAISW